MQNNGHSSDGHRPGRRRAPRFAVDYDLKVDVHGENVPYTGLIKDISSGGIFITTINSHSIGQMVQVRFTFPTLGRPVEAHARVQWIRDVFCEGDLPPGIGVCFQDLDPELIERINQFISDKDVPFYDEGV